MADLTRDPISFLQFCGGLLGIVLTDAQRVLCAVCFDGAQPRDFRGGDRDIARKLFGAIETIPRELLGVVLWLKGARIGGTYLGALRCLHLALTIGLQSLAAGEIAFVIFVAPDLRLGRQALRYVHGAIDGHPALRSIVQATTSDSVTIRRPDGHFVCFLCLPATRGGSALRGRSIAAAILTEAAFLRDVDYVVNDAELYKAIAPRVLPGGGIVIETTPFSEAGLAYDLFTQNHGKPTTCVAAHCPTLLLRDDPHTRAMVEREYRRDPDNHDREFGAIFMPYGTFFFFDSIAIDRCVVDEAA